MISTSISCLDLVKKLELSSRPKVKTLFTTMANAPASKPVMLPKSASVYIPNSLFFDFENDFVDKATPLSNMMPLPKKFQLSAQVLGLNLDDEIVVYDDFGNFCASRAWFMFLCMGFTNVKTLDGGLPEWIKCGYSTNKTLLSAGEQSNVQLRPSVNYAFIDANYICTALSLSIAPLLIAPAMAITTTTSEAEPSAIRAAQIIDARSSGRYIGSEREPRDDMRSGHIPNSLNIHYASLQHNGKFKSTDELAAIFEDKNIILSEEIITSCGSGVTACIVAQAAYSLGASCVKVYDASWSEWGASQTLPIEVGE
jgi:thiosulfate/3-mercaptopyruvate sulfurtransferase